MLFLAAQTLIVGLLVLGLYELRGRFGLSPIFVFVASIQFLQNLLATSAFCVVFGSLVVSPGSAVLFSSTLFALLLIYVKEDVTTARRLIYAVLLANLTLSLVALGSRWASSMGYLQLTDSGADWLATYSALGFAVGTVCLLADAFALLILYEVLRSRLAWLPLGALLVLPLTIVLAVDTVIFTAVMQGGFEATPLLLGSLFGKSFSGVLYGCLLTAYLALRRDRALDESSREIRDPFSILTFGQRYRALEQEVKSLGQRQELDRQRAEVALRGAARAEERQLRLGHILENSVNEIYTFDPETLLFLDVNAGARANLGYSLEELRGLTPVDLKPEFTFKSFAELIAPLRAGSRGKIEFTTIHQRKDGTRYPVEVHLQKLADGEPVFVAIILDISRRQEADRERRRVERRYRELFEEAPLKYVVTENRDGVPWITDCNSTFLVRLGYERSQVVEHPLSEFYSPESARQMLEGGGYANALKDRVQAERQLVTRSGGLVDALLVALPETGPGSEVTGTRAMYVDITARKQAEKELERTGRQLRALSHRLEAVREEERKALAREIHDELGQALTGLKLEIAWVDEKVASREPVIRERIDSMLEIVESSLSQVRDLSARLRPAALDDLGLGAAVDGHAQEFSRRYGIDCRVATPVDDRWLDGVDSEAATALFRILQEAMTNVLRHAEATRIDITMKRTTAELELRIEDDGKGIDLHAVADDRSLGLLGMRERAEHCGGSLEIGRSKSGGTVVTARVPA